MPRKKATKATEKTGLDPAIEAINNELRKKYNNEMVRVYDKEVVAPFIPTGIVKLDRALGGGLPVGRVVELYGEPSTGKSTIVLQAMVEAQRLHPDKVCVFIDMEHALDTTWAKKLGIQFDKLIHCQPEFGEEALYIAEAYLKSGKCSVIAVDSVAALLPEKVMQGDIGDANIGAQARLVSQVMQRMNSILFKTPTVVILINQTRDKIQGGAQSMRFESVKTTGGKSIKFYTTTRLELKRIKTHARGTGNEREDYAQDVLVKVDKHKVLAGPGARIVFRIDKRYGVDTAHEILQWAIKNKKVVKKGAWFEFGDDRVQGDDAAKTVIREQHLPEWHDEMREDNDYTATIESDIQDAEE